MLRLLDTFSGIGGFSYAAEHLVGGYQTVAFVEREPFCQSILRKHWPDVPIYDDITTFTPEPGSADVVCGGFPCQDISIAGKQAGIKQGTRSGLFYELIRVVRTVQPSYVVMENVSAITSNGLGTVLGELAEAGFDAEWACIPASAVGACHQRDRWWLVAYPQGQQRNDRGSAYPAEPARALSQLGNSDGTAIANTIRHRSQGQIRIRACGTAWPQEGLRRLDPSWRGYVSEPILRRGDDGLSRRVDRLKALGNAVVPQVAAIPLQRVKELAA
jgi:DNA (cytosine-5)-methyltransferase 1